MSRREADRVDLECLVLFAKLKLKKIDVCGSNWRETDINKQICSKAQVCGTFPSLLLCFLTLP